MTLTNSLVVLFIAVLLQIFWRNFYSNASCFSLLWLYLGILNLGNSQVSVYRTIGPTLVFNRGYACAMIVQTNAIQFLPELFMNQFDTVLSTLWIHIEHMQ